MVKKLEDYIKKAFTDVGFSDEEIVNGCWLLERKDKKTDEMKAIAWIALHKFLERVAQRANIIFDEPKVFNCTDTEVAIYVNGRKGENQAWSIGEASPSNLTQMSGNYRWAMAEKRAKDRVILKLLGIAGDMYSEEEADEFKKHEEPVNPKNDLLDNFKKAISFLKGLKTNPKNDEVLMKKINTMISKLDSAELFKEKEELENLVNDLMKKEN